MRRHRNPPTRGTIRVAADARVDDVPEPALPLEGDARTLWHRIWTQPVATLWTEADVAPLTRLVQLQIGAGESANAKLMGELRQLEDRFLMNPYARAQMRVVVGDDEDAPEPVDEIAVNIANYRRMLGAS